MAADQKKSSGLDILRTKAERIVASKKDEGKQFSPEEVKDLLHELHVHQVELEMQNTELHRIKVFCFSWKWNTPAHP